MKSAKQKKRSANRKEKALADFNTGKYTQRELADKYKISEWGLSKYISRRLSLIIK